MRDRGLEPFQLLDLLRRHASPGGAHVLSRDHGPMRVLEAHIIKIRLLGAEAALELACVGGALTSSAPSRSRRGRTPNGTYLLLEAHAVATLLDGVFVKTFALLRERHELVRLRVTRRVDAARGDDESGRLGITRASPDAARGLCCQISPAAGAFLSQPWPLGLCLYFPALDTVVKPLPLCPKSISG